MHMVSLVVGTISYNQATSTIQHACILKLKGLQRLFLGYIASLQIYSFRVKQWKFRLKIIDCWKVWRVALHPGNEPFVSIVWIPFESNHCNNWCQVIGNQGGLTDINIQQFSVTIAKASDSLSSTSGMGFPDSSDLGPAFKAPNPGSRCSSGFETFGPKWSTFWNCKGWTPLSFFSSQFSLQTKFTLLPLDGVLALPLRCFDNHEMLREKVKKTIRQKNYLSGLMMTRNFLPTKDQ